MFGGHEDDMPTYVGPGWSSICNALRYGAAIAIGQGNPDTLVRVCGIETFNDSETVQVKLLDMEGEEFNTDFKAVDDNSAWFRLTQLSFTTRRPARTPVCPELEGLYNGVRPAVLAQLDLGALYFPFYSDTAQCYHFLQAHGVDYTKGTVVLKDFYFARHEARWTNPSVRGVTEYRFQM